MPQTPRSIRVFLSSTFLDMQEERDVLMKFVFPKLRKMCEERGVSFSGVDLRWGITEEQSRRGEALPICLAEIEHCRPFFIGLLGERYGWVPDEVPQTLVSQHPWLEEHRHKSVTELEIVHGVLSQADMTDRACFYFRDPIYLGHLPDLRRVDYVEQDPVARNKLALLKKRIRRSGAVIRENYPDPRTLGNWVLEDLTTLINQEFPPGPSPTTLDREAALHDAFALSRRHVYVSNQGDLDRLDEHVAGTSLPMVVLGESGSGKSALLANWAAHYSHICPDDFVLLHFVGASADSSDCSAMLQRLMGELGRKFNLAHETPDTPAKLRSAFTDLLYRASACCDRTESRPEVTDDEEADKEARPSRIVLIIDALDQLDDREGAPDLVWLPPVLPENVRLILSTLDGRPRDEVEKREWPTLTINPLSAKARSQLIRSYLGRYAKQLRDDRVQHIIDSPQTGNPLFLRALLEELRLFGIFEQLDERIEFYLQAKSIPALFQKILERCEQDYEQHRPGLVKDAMSLIWGARRGLSESELLDLLGTYLQRDGSCGISSWLKRHFRRAKANARGTAHPLSHAIWSPLFLALEQSLVIRSGQILFFHDYLRQAVRDRYLSTHRLRKRVHLRLSDYFGNSEIPSRRLEEFPWQLKAMEDWSRLRNLLGTPHFFLELKKFSPYDLSAYWTTVDRHSSRSMMNSYRNVVNNPSGQSAEFLLQLADQLDVVGHSFEALRLRDFLSRNHQQLPAVRDRLLVRFAHSQSLLKLGKLLEAGELLQQLESELRKIGADVLLAKVLNQQGLLAKRQDDPERALLFHMEQQHICEQTGDIEELLGSQFNQAVIRLRKDEKNETDRAKQLLADCERKAQAHGLKRILLRCLQEQAIVYLRQGVLDTADELLARKELICVEIGDKRALSTCYTIQADILVRRNEISKALDLISEKIALCEEIGDTYELVIALNNRAAVLVQQPDGREESRRCKAAAYKLAMSHGYTDLANRLHS